MEKLLLILQKITLALRKPENFEKIKQEKGLKEVLISYLVITGSNNLRADKTKE